MTAACLFCRIARGEESAELVLESEQCVAFLDHRPLIPGHALLVPRPHVVALPDLPDVLLEPLFRDARRLARAMEHGLGAEGSFVAINNTVSQSVPHLHVHVVPRRKGDGLKGFFWPRTKYASPEEMASVAARLRAALAGDARPRGS